jgi:HlyD family secretion protein
VAFIGLGVMGSPMAAHLARAGHQVCVHNRSQGKADAWVAEHGGRAAPTAREAAAPLTYRTAPVTKRDVQKVVSSTGTVTADPTVEVGTQVSGLLSEVLVDYNDRVREGQVLARIDTALLQADVDAARARLEESQARRDRLSLEQARVTALHAKGATSDEERDAARAELAIATAQARAAKVTLSRARRNLTYATIRAPIAGTGGIARCIYKNMLLILI